MLPNNVIVSFFEENYLDFRIVIDTLVATTHISIPAQIVAACYANARRIHYRVAVKSLTKRPESIPVSVANFCDLPEPYLAYIIRSYNRTMQIKLASLFFWHRQKQSQGILSELCDCYYDQPITKREPSEQQLYFELKALKFPKPTLAFHYSQLHIDKLSPTPKATLASDYE